MTTSNNKPLKDSKIKSQGQQIAFPDSMINQVRTLNRTCSDFNALARCLNSFKDSDSWPGGFGGQFVFTGKYLENDYETRDLSTNFVAIAPDDPSRIVGVCFINPSREEADNWFVGSLGVDPNYQGRKLGKALLLQATSYAMKRGADFIGLETWPGNLKAMPLYKRQGYMWRPDTSVFMRNYIPQILNFPFFQEFFASLETTWYDAFKPVITQKPNRDFEEKMQVYEYYFEENSNSLRVWIDRTVGKISGFHLITEKDNILIKLFSPNSEAYIGAEVFPISLYLENFGEHELHLRISSKSSNNVLLESKFDEEFNLTKNEKTILKIKGELSPDTTELLIKDNPQSFTDHKISVQFTIEDLNFSLELGKIPIYLLKVKTSPSIIDVYTSKKIVVPLTLQNNIDRILDVNIQIKEGQYLKINKKNFTKSVGVYDSIIHVPMVLKENISGVDNFNVKVTNSDGKILFQRDFPVPIFKEGRTVSYEFENQLYIENKHIRMSLNKNPRPERNEVVIEEKFKGLFMYGLPIILGYPFDSRGSEFYTLQLNHKITRENNGIWIISSTTSNKNLGVSVQRKLFVPDDNPVVKVLWKVENLSKEVKRNLGIQIIGYWMKNQQQEINRIISHKEGLLHIRFFAFPIDMGNNPSQYTEGWLATEYPTGTIGHCYDLNSIDKISAGGFPEIEFKIPDLNPAETYETTPYYCIFTDSWQFVRKFWNDNFSNNLSIKFDSSLQTRSHKRFGLGCEKYGSSICDSLILDLQTKEFEIVVDTLVETALEGVFDIKLQDTMPNHHQIELSGGRGNFWKTPVKLESINNRVISGTLSYDSKTRIFPRNISIGFYNSSEKILIAKNTSNNSIEVNNGFINFVGSERYRGNIFSLLIDNKQNILHTGNVDYPKIEPFLWFNEFYGGIGSILCPANTWEIQEFNKLKFNFHQVTRGIWQGIGFETEIITYIPSLKGLQLNINYLTLPSSPFLLIQQEVINHSEAHRYFNLRLDISLKTSQSDQDRYYINSKDGLLTYRTQDWQSNIFIEKEPLSRWAAYKKANSDDIIALILPERIGNYEVIPYSPNFKIFFLNAHLRSMQINPLQKLTLNSILLITDSLEKVEPFINSNLQDLL